MSNLIDGILFARKREDYRPHMIRRGKNQRMVMRADRSGGGYDYLEMDDFHSRYSTDNSEAARILRDPMLNLADTATRGVLHDALIDANREEEASLLAGPRGESLVVHNDRLIEPHNLRVHECVLTIQRELDLTYTGSQHNWRKRGLVFLPGDVGNIPGRIDVGVALMGGAGGDTKDVPLACLLTTLRRWRHQPHGPYSPGILRDEAIHLANEQGDKSCVTALLGTSNGWGHAMFSQPVGEPFEVSDRRGQRYRVEIRSMPVLGGRSSSFINEPWGPTGYYYVRTVLDRPGSPLARGRTDGRLFRHIQATEGIIHDRLDQGTL